MIEQLKRKNSAVGKDRYGAEASSRGESKSKAEKAYDNRASTPNEKPRTAQTAGVKINPSNRQKSLEVTLKQPNKKT